jgi:uncharacterized paraquat-inducible protein A
VSEPGAAPCRNCGHSFAAEELDAGGWCPRCRRAVIRRATVAGWTVALLGAGGLAYLLFIVLELGQRFLLAWLLLVAAVYYILYKLTRRVAFEMFRARGVPREEV